MNNQPSVACSMRVDNSQATTNQSSWVIDLMCLASSQVIMTIGIIDLLQTEQNLDSGRFEFYTSIETMNKLPYVYQVHTDMPFMRAAVKFSEWVNLLNDNYTNNIWTVIPSAYVRNAELTVGFTFLLADSMVAMLLKMHMSN
jgi:hypothetical protein